MSAIQWNSDADYLDVADLAQPFPAVLWSHHTIVWTRHGETRMILWLRLANAVQTYNDFQSAKANGRLQEVPAVLLYWGDATPVLVPTEVTLNPTPR